MGSRPACRGLEFVAARVELTQVGFVFAGGAVGHRVKLEVDLVEPAREMHPQRGAVGAALEPLEETAGESEVEQARRAGVQPTFVQAEVAGNSITRRE